MIECALLICKSVFGNFGEIQYLKNGSKQYVNLIRSGVLVRDAVLVSVLRH